MISDIVNENIDDFNKGFWLDWSNKVKYIDLFKRGITSGDTLGLFFIKDSKAVCELVKYYKDFKRIIIYDSNATTSLLKDYDSDNKFNDPRVEYFDVGQDIFMKFDKIIMNPPYNLGNKIRVSKVAGTLTDNFNPRTNVISLSSDIYSDSSIASVAVAAHECGHVLQHEQKYFFIMLRSILVPIVNFSSNFGYIILIAGFLFSAFDLAMLGLIFMCMALVFQLVTLPTEFDASNRAAKELVSLGVITETELPQVKKMLRAAAYTYLASFFANMAQILRLFLSIRRNDD